MPPGLRGKQRRGDEEKGMNNTEALFYHHSHWGAEELNLTEKLMLTNTFKKYSTTTTYICDCTAWCGYTYFNTSLKPN